MSRYLVRAARGLMAVAALAVKAEDTVPLIPPNDPVAAWAFDYGREFPGATGTLTTAETTAPGGGPVLKLAGDFTRGGNYVQAGRKIGRVDIRVLSLRIRNPDAAPFTIRLNDASGQTHQMTIRLQPTADWQTVELPLQDFFARRGGTDAVASIARYESWGGAKDGNWHGPATAIYLLIGKPEGTKTPAVWLSGIDIAPPPVPVAGAEITEMMRLDEIVDEHHDWAFSSGAEFPGAKGALTTVRNEPGTTNPCFRLAGDFTGGGAYVAMIRDCADVDAPDVRAIHLRLKTDNARGIGVQLVDGSGQTHQRSPYPVTADGQWHDLILRPAEIAGGEHWGGANDGRWHGGLKQVVLSARNSPDGRQPVFLVTDVRAEIRRPVFRQPAAFTCDFAGMTQLPRDWETAGGATLDVRDGAGRGAVLELARTENDAGVPCSVRTPAFAVTPGRWSVGFDWLAELRSPDNSYNAVVTLECLDDGGRVIDRITLLDAYGTHGWQQLRQQVELPRGAARARFQAQLNKTWGRFRVDALSAAFLAPAARRDDRIARVLFSTSQPGNLLFPEERRVVTMTIEARRPLPEEQRVVSCTVRDYWGAEQAAPVTANLDAPERQGPLFLHRATIDLAGVALATGRYYEVHIAIPRGEGEPYRDYTSLAILPPAATKRYKPEEVPFTSRNWDNRITEYVRLTDRLGVRVCGIWGGWSPKPPYAAEAPALDLCAQFGMGWLTGTPIVGIERGERQYDESALRAGISNLIAKFGHVRPMIVNLGNEPHGTGERVRANVEAYRVVYEEVKKVDPSITVVATSVEPNEEYFKLGYGKWCDAFDFHEYEAVENVRTAIRQYRELMKKYGCEKPIWSTELGLNSQGQTRVAVARSLYKKLCVFFADGGVNVSWFGLLYPDPEGKARGSSGDAHNMFDCRYNRYAPRLDAIAYYHAVNAIAIKAFAQEKAYPGGVHAFLFRDRDGRSLQVLWKDAGREDVLIPLAGVRAVRVIGIDGGSRALDAGGRGVTLTVTEDPVLLLYDGGPAALADALGAPEARLVAMPATIARGATFALGVETTGRVDVVAPPFWRVERGGAGDRPVFSLTCPAASAVREADIAISLTSAEGRPSGELRYRAAFNGR